MLPRTGDLLGRKYRLGTELGRGAMGIVYEARHETLDQSVAIKILRAADLEDREAAVRRFEREARIIAKLDSAHVVKVIDVDRTDDGVPYLVMERLAGRDLAAEVEARGEARVPPGEAVTWMAQVCSAMVVAHEAGVVHRDLKLSNVFLGEDGVVKVLDFGVAVLKHGDAERSITTRLAGTPRYMAPEQLLGESPNPASDVWAIGVMLYRLLSGRFPFDAPTMAAQMLAMMEGFPSLSALAPELPPALVAVVRKALGHGIEERWGSAKELAGALGPFGGAGAKADAKADADAKAEADAKAKAEAEAEAEAKAGARRRRMIAGAVLALIAAAVGVRALGMRADAPVVRERAQADAALASPQAGAALASPPTGVVVIEPVVSAASSTASTASSTVAGTPSSSAARRAPPSASAVRPRASGEKAVAPPASATAEDGFPAHL